MKAKRLTHTLLALSALFITLGAVLGLWFYAVAGLSIALYLCWRFLAFQSFLSEPDIKITRTADKTVTRPGARVIVETSVSSNAPVTGSFTDVLPSGVELVEGTNRFRLSLRARNRQTWRYGIINAGREPMRIERTALTVDNSLFTHTILFTSAALEVKQPLNVVNVEARAGGGIGRPRITGTSVQALLRERGARAGMDASGVRPYAVGDPVKHIHWKASARLNRLMTKQFFSEMEDAIGSTTSLSLIIDQSATMGRGIPAARELDFAVNVAGNFVKLAVAKGTPIGLTTYDENDVAVDVGIGSSPSHVWSVVRSLNEITPSVSAPLRYRRKLDVTGSDVARVKRQFAATATNTNEDIDRFRYVISYLYSYAEGYAQSLKRAPAFRAIASSLRHAYGQATLVLVSDLENDFGPLTEGIRLATAWGAHVVVVALFSKLFERFDDAVLAVEDIYSAFDKFEALIHKLERLSNVTVIEANLGNSLQSMLKEVRVTPWRPTV
jgi:uncharacterized protein (DUF58 family)